jgi:hypothetical protein
MLKNILMTDFLIKYDTDLQLNSTVQTIDLTAFHRHDNWTPTDKKENKICQRFAFLKISAYPLAAHCQAIQTNPQTKACQRAAILPTIC